MFDFSFYELMVFGIIALIVLGPEKLPQAVRTVGTYYAKFRRTVGTLKAEMEAELDLAETRQKMQEELAKIKQAEAEMQREMEQLRGNMKEFEAQQNSQLQATTQGGAASIAATTPTQNDEKEWVHPIDKANPNMAAPTAVATDYSYDTNPNSNTLGSEDSVAQVADESTEQVTTQGQETTATDPVVEPAMTRPWENMWFLLGAYDKAKRLPPAPLLPNYTANPLLYNTKTASPLETSDDSATLSTAMTAEVKS